MKPTVIVGDVQGDVERLVEGLKPFDPVSTNTVFLGDFFDGGASGMAGGSAAADVARSRPNSVTVLGNHEVFILCVIELRRGVPLPIPPPSGMIRAETELSKRISTITPEQFMNIWVGRRGDWADIARIEQDPDLEAWMRQLPIMIKLEDDTLIQHPDTTRFLEHGATIEAINQWGKLLLEKPGGVFTLLPVMSARQGFADRPHVDAYLEVFEACRIVHGHTPHQGIIPLESHDGRVLCFDGKFSRFWAQGPSDTSYGPIEATIGLLAPFGSS